MKVTPGIVSKIEELSSLIRPLKNVDFRGNLQPAKLRNSEGRGDSGKGWGGEEREWPRVPPIGLEAL